MRRTIEWLFSIGFLLLVASMVMFGVNSNKVNETQTQNIEKAPRYWLACHHYFDRRETPTFISVLLDDGRTYQVFADKEAPDGNGRIVWVMPLDGDPTRDVRRYWFKKSPPAPYFKAVQKRFDEAIEF